MSAAQKRQAARAPLGPESLDVAQRILFIGLAESDFMQASEAAGAALKLVGDRSWLPCSTYLALAEAALIRYARPFTGNRMPGMKQKAALPLSYLPAIDGVEAFHRSVMDLRHEFGAHSDMTKRDLWIERLNTPEGDVHWRGHAMCAWMTPPDMYRLQKVALAMVTALKSELSKLADAAFPTLGVGAKVQITAARTTAVRPQ